MSEPHDNGRLKPVPGLSFTLPILLVLALVSGCDRTVGRNTTDAMLGSRVLVFDDGMDMRAIQTRLDTLHERQKLDEFSDERFALLFKPGEYDLTVTVDYYVQAAGLGMMPGDVRIRGAVQSVASTSDNKVTTMFWRGAENFHVVPDADPMPWGATSISTRAAGPAAACSRIPLSKGGPD